MTYRLGKRPATRDDRDLLFAKYRADTLPPAPVGFDHTALVQHPWQMLANDRYGDCAIAGPAHETMLLNAAAGRQVEFNDEVVLDAYSVITGFDPNDPASDQGSNVRDVLKYRASKGLEDASGAVHTIGAYVALTPGSWDELLQALYVFETVGIGLRFPNSAMTQFENGEPWDLVPNDPEPDEGHYVCVVNHPADDTVQVVTWGKLQTMTRAFYEHWNDESFCYVSEEDLSTEGATLEGFKLDELKADLAEL